MHEKVGLMTVSRTPILETAEVAKQAEDAGLHSVWYGDGGGDVFGALTAFAMKTTTIQLGSSLALWTRPPTVAAGSAAQLAELSNGRFIFGLGPGPRDRNQRWWGIDFNKPVGRMKEYVTILQDMLGGPAGAPYTFQGDHFQIEGAPRPARLPHKPPILLGTVGMQMNRLAGRIADGVLLDVCLPPSYLKNRAIPAVLEGLEKSGRPRSAITISATIVCAIDDDIKTARHELKKSIISHLAQDYFDPVWAGIGVYDQFMLARERLKAGDVPGAFDAISDEFAAAVGIAGNADSVRKQVGEWLEILDTVKLTPPSFRSTNDQVADARLRIIETFQK